MTVLELESGYRLLEDHEIVQKGDKFFCPNPKPGFIQQGTWYTIHFDFCDVRAGQCKKTFRSWYDDPIYFATNRPDPEPEPIVIGKLLGDLNSDSP